MGLSKVKIIKRFLQYLHSKKDVFLLCFLWALGQSVAFKSDSV